MKNPNSLDTLCGALTYLMGVDTPEFSAEKSSDLVDFCVEKFNGEQVDRIFMYNPDAIGQWVYEKYEYLVKEEHIKEVATKHFNEGKIRENVYKALMQYSVDINDITMNLSAISKTTFYLISS